MNLRKHTPLYEKAWNNTKIALMETSNGCTVGIQNPDVSRVWMAESRSGVKWSCFGKSPVFNSWISDPWLAMLLICVNKQIFKVNLKNLFLFFLAVLFCCDVGESDLELKARCRSSCGLYKKFFFYKWKYRKHRANRLLLVKCNYIKMVKLPGCSSKGAPSCS